jgi:error-prone DNA polymerase
LAARAAELGYEALAITDECSVVGIVKGHLAAKAVGLHLIIGSQMQVTPDDGSPPFCLLVLAMNRTGYGDLCELITAARMRAEKGAYLVTPSDIAAPEGDLAHLRGMPDCQLILVPSYCIDAQTLGRQPG